MIIATAVSSQTTPAAVEFALLQSWLASGSALQLSLQTAQASLASAQATLSQQGSSLGDFVLRNSQAYKRIAPA